MKKKNQPKAKAKFAITKQRIVKPAKKINSAPATEEQPAEIPPKAFSLPKHELICAGKKCKYKRTLVKSKLNDGDYVCPKCGNAMNEKGIPAKNNEEMPEKTEKRNARLF